MALPNMFSKPIKPETRKLPLNFSAIQMKSFTDPKPVGGVARLRALLRRDAASNPVPTSTYVCARYLLHKAFMELLRKLLTSWVTQGPILEWPIRALRKCHARRRQP